LSVAVAVEKIFKKMRPADCQRALDGVVFDDDQTDERASLPIGARRSAHDRAF
jgi:hypothetical protein